MSSSRYPSAPTIDTNELVLTHFEHWCSKAEANGGIDRSKYHTIYTKAVKRNVAALMLAIKYPQFSFEASVTETAMNDWPNDLTICFTRDVMATVFRLSNGLVAVAPYAFFKPSPHVPAAWSIMRYKEDHTLATCTFYGIE